MDKEKTEVLEAFYIKDTETIERLEEELLLLLKSKHWHETEFLKSVIKTLQTTIRFICE